MAAQSSLQQPAGFLPQEPSPEDYEQFFNENGPDVDNDDDDCFEDYTNRQTILFKISSLTYPVDLIPLEASTRPNVTRTGAPH